MNNLVDIEKQLIELFISERKNWVSIYLLLKIVDEEILWRGNYNSYTQWIKEFAVRSKVHESSIWHIKKMGAVYEKYSKKMEAKGMKVDDIKNTKVSANNLVVLEKISKYSPERTEELVEKIFKKEITKNDLEEIYRAVRPSKINNENNNSIAFKTDGEIRTEKIKNNIKASTILSTLYEYENWLGQKKVRKYFKSSYEQDKIQCFSEFPVYTGSTKKSRRIDFLAVENMTTDNLWELNIHGIEIKVTESDFINDEKYTEYTEFVDYFYLAVPEELKDIALKNKFKDCGLIVISKDKTNKFRLCHNKQLINSHFYRGALKLPYKFELSKIVKPYRLLFFLLLLKQYL